MNRLIFLTTFIFLSLSLYAKDWEEVAEITAANLRGHELMYNEGFYVIPSTKLSIEYIQKNSAIKTAREEWLRIVTETTEKTHRFTSELEKNPELAQKVYSNLQSMRKDLKMSWDSQSKKLIHFEKELARDSFHLANADLIQGLFFIKERTTEDRHKLIAIPNNFFSNLKSDYSNLKELLTPLKSKYRTKLSETLWEESFDKASQEFNKEYIKSGDQGNSLEALPRVIWGHMKALYYGILSPSTKVATQTTKKGIENLLLIPTAGSAVVLGRTLYSVGGVVYYSTKIGVDILTPEIQSAYHAAVGIISASAIAPTFLVSESIGLFGQAAMELSSYSGGAATYTVASAVDGAQYLSSISYDLLKSSGKVAIKGATNAVVLGYNAITALPAHLIVGSINATFFLVYDGPKIFIAWSKGDLGALPVGSVIDFNALKNLGVHVEELTTDEKGLNHVIEQSANDLRR